MAGSSMTTWYGKLFSGSARGVPTVADRATCSNGCCEFFPIDSRTPGWRNSSERDDTGRLFVRCCPKTGEKLSGHYGQPVVEPRPSPEYVELLEGYARNEHLPEDADPKCLSMWCSLNGLVSPAGLCSHGDWPVGCLKALAAKREEAGSRV